MRQSAHELLFCLNLALVLKLEGNQKLSRLTPLLDFGESTIQLKVNHYLRLHPDDSFGANLAFLLLALVFAVLMFVLLRILLASSSIRRAFQAVAGVISLIALPLGWFWVAATVGISPPFSNPPHVLLYLELLAAAVCAGAYLIGKWPLPSWVTIALLTAHFAYWDFLVSGGPYFWRNPFRLLFPIVGFLAVLTWGMDVSRSRVSASTRD